MTACADDAPQPANDAATAPPEAVTVTVVATATPTNPAPEDTPAPPANTATPSAKPQLAANVATPTSPPVPAQTSKPTPAPPATPTPAPTSTPVANDRQSGSVTWTFPPTIDGEYLHFAGEISSPSLLEEFILKDNPYCSQFQLYRGSGQRDWAAGVAEPLLVGWYYHEIPGAAVINGRINPATGQFSITARINHKSLAEAGNLHLTLESRVGLGPDGFCLPSETFSEIPVVSGRIPEGLKVVEHYHLNAIQWSVPPAITGDTMQFAGQASPGAVRLTYQDGYCGQFHLYEYSAGSYHYIDLISPLLPSGRFWTESTFAEVTSQRTTADGIFEATVKLNGPSLKNYRNLVLAVETPAVWDSNANQCGDSETLSAIDILSSPAMLSPMPTPAPVLPPTPAATPSPTPRIATPEPTPMPTATPAAMPETTPAPTLAPGAMEFSQYDTQNTRWLKGQHPDLYEQIQSFPWATDGLTESERENIDDLLYIGANDLDNLRNALNLPWVQDDITESEEETLKHLHWIALDDPDAVRKIIAMPFLESLEYDDLLAVQAMKSLEYDGLLSALMDTPEGQMGFTDAQTTLVAAAGTLKNRQEVQRLLNPGYAKVQSVSAGTTRSPDLKISIVRTGTQPQPGTPKIVRDAVELVEGMMQLPLTVSHVIVVLNQHAVFSGAAGVNFGFAFSYLPEMESDETPLGRHLFRSGVTHEVSHYFWRRNADWIDEGLANVTEHIYGVEAGLSPGLLQANRQDCETPDLQTLATLDPGRDSAQFYCNYYLGQLLFQELLETMGQAEFEQRLRQLYQLSLEAEDPDDPPGISEIRQAFHGQTAIINKHWSGRLNAPENRPYDDAGAYRNHGLVEWLQFPVYNGRTVKLEGKLLGDAVFQDVNLKNPSSEGLYYSNFTIYSADGGGYVGSILPGDNWILNPADAAASTHNYYPETRTFTVEFPFPAALGEPSDYTILVLGFPDESRTPYIRKHTDILGFARIRSP